jgi:hypothetical protein
MSFVNAIVAEMIEKRRAREQASDESPMEDVPSPPTLLHSESEDTAPAKSSSSSASTEEEEAEPVQTEKPTKRSRRTAPVPAPASTTAMDEMD